MDDIVIIVNNSKFFLEIITKLGKEFSIKYLGPLNYFLCIDVRYFLRELHLSQTKYVAELFDKIYKAMDQ